TRSTCTAWRTRNWMSAAAESRTRPWATGAADRSVVSDPPSPHQGRRAVEDRGRTKLLGLLAAGDPKGEVKLTWHMLLCQLVVMRRPRVVLVGGGRGRCGGVGRPRRRSAV